MFNRRQRYGDRRREAMGPPSTGERRGRRADRRIRMSERRGRILDRRSIQDFSRLGPFDRRYRMTDRRSNGRT